jgi:hypothetical protein
MYCGIVLSAASFSIFKELARRSFSACGTASAMTMIAKFHFGGQGQMSQWACGKARK